MANQREQIQVRDPEVRYALDRAAGATGDCNACPHWKRKGSPKRGQMIPQGYGKCIRPQGHCSPERVRGERVEHGKAC